MKAQYIQLLVAISDAGSIRGAAKLLGKSQPALTKAVKQVEEEMGLPLFQRTSRGMQLTEIGRLVVARSRIIVSEMNRLNVEIAQFRGEKSDEITVCVSPFAATLIMPKAMTLFRQSFPNVFVHMTSGMYPDALKPLREGKTDLIVGPTPPEATATGVNVEHLGDKILAIVTSRTSRHAKASSLADLISAEWILFGTNTGPGDAFRRTFIESGLPPPRAMTTTESFFGAMAMIKRQGAICVIPKLLLKEVSAHWSITEIPVHERIEKIEFSLMTRVDKVSSPAVDALVNCIRRSAGTT